MLQFAELNEVFPIWVNNSGTSSSSYCPVEELEHITNKYFKPQMDTTVHLQGIKEGTKFRIIDGKLYVDNRKFKWIRRKMSGDSRWKVLNIIKELVDKYNIHSDILCVVKVMYEGVYKNDMKWKEELYSIIPERYLEITHCVSPMSGGERKVSYNTLQVISDTVYNHGRIMLDRKLPRKYTEEQTPPPYIDESSLNYSLNSESLK